MWAGQVIGTYLHGPVLARNPALADLLLAGWSAIWRRWTTREQLALRAERLAAARGRRGRADGRAAMVASPGEPGDPDRRAPWASRPAPDS